MPCSYSRKLSVLRHGFRLAELIALQWDVVELDGGRLHVSRVKEGIPSVHPLRGPEIRALRRLRRDPDSPYVFVSERGGPLTDSVVRKIVARAGEKAGLEFPVHPRMLRRATGYKLANDGHDTRANITCEATRTSSTRSATPSSQRRGFGTSGCRGTTGTRSTISPNHP